MRYNLLAFLSLIFLLTLSNCRKGENDPLISLRTRKARLTGDWLLKEGNLTRTYSTSNSSATHTTTYSNSKKTVNDNGSTRETSYTQRLTLRKDNSFEREIIDNNIKTIHFGSWSFVHKNKDQKLKNKEAILLSIDSYTINGVTTVNTGIFLSEFLRINRLANKELIFKGETTRNYTSGDKDTKKYEYKFEKV